MIIVIKKMKLCVWMLPGFSCECMSLSKCKIRIFKALFRADSRAKEEVIGADVLKNADTSAETKQKVSEELEYMRSLCSFFSKI